MLAECRARIANIRRALLDLPAGDERQHTLNTSDADLLFEDHSAYTTDTFDVGARKTAVL
jgi:hypothetical protein